MIFSIIPLKGKKSKHKIVHNKKIAKGKQFKNMNKLISLPAVLHRHRDIFSKNLKISKQGVNKKPCFCFSVLFC